MEKTVMNVTDRMKQLVRIYLHKKKEHHSVEELT